MTNATLRDLHARSGAAWTHLTRQRRGMEPHQPGVDAQRRSAFAYLKGLPEPELVRRKLRIPDEISLTVAAGATFDYHWSDHAGQLAKIRQAAGLADAT